MTKDQLKELCKAEDIIYPAQVQRSFGVNQSDAFDALQDLAKAGFLRRARTEEIAFKWIKTSS